MTSNIAIPPIPMIDGRSSSNGRYLDGNNQQRNNHLLNLAMQASSLVGRNQNSDVTNNGRQLLLEGINTLEQGGGNRNLAHDVSDLSSLTKNSIDPNKLYRATTGADNEESNDGTMMMVKRCVREMIWSDTKFLTDQHLAKVYISDNENVPDVGVIGKLLTTTRKQKNTIC